MKATYSIPLFLVLFIFSSCDNYSDEKIISKTVKKLNSIQTIEYVLNFELGNDMIGEKIEIKGNCYFDFRSNDSLVGTKYVVTSSDQNNSIARFFDGKSLIEVDDYRKEIVKNDNPRFYDLNTNVFIWHSIAKLKKVLPLMQNDSTVVFTRLNDTIINNIESYQFKVEMKNKWLGGNSNIEKSERTVQYNLAIKKSSILFFTMAKK